jgi:uncharacterized protein DUF2630
MSAGDPQILSRIGELVEEENQLLNRHRETPLEESEQSRLKQVQVQLDQCWDLLNQRRALREFGLDPDQATVRDPDTVEGYLQ